MEVRATGKYIKVQPRKVRIVAAKVKGKQAVHAAHLLGFHTSKGARELRKVLISAIANAAENNQLPQEGLKIRCIQVDEGPRQKRITQKAMGRGARIVKKTSHITVVVEDYEPKAATRPHGTKAKPRPTLVVKTSGKKKGVAKAEAAPVEEVVETPEQPVEEVVEATAPAAEENEAPAAEGEN
jgi:large subunit ribosomal protein L22